MRLLPVLTCWWVVSVQILSKVIRNLALAKKSLLFAAGVHGGVAEVVVIDAVADLTTYKMLKLGENFLKGDGDM